MQSDEEDVLRNLLVLGALAQNDKLVTSGGSFYIHRPSVYRSVARYWYGECRSENIERVRSIVRAAIGFVVRSLDEIRELSSLQNNRQNLKVRMLVNKHVRMLEALRVASNGIKNLNTTYQDDARHISQIYLTVSEIDDFLGGVALENQKFVKSRDESYDDADLPETVRRSLVL